MVLIIVLISVIQPNLCAVTVEVEMDYKTEYVGDPPMV